MNSIPSRKAPRISTKIKHRMENFMKRMMSPTNSAHCSMTIDLFLMSDNGSADDLSMNELMSGMVRLI